MAAFVVLQGQPEHPSGGFGPCPPPDARDTGSAGSVPGWKQVPSTSVRPPVLVATEGTPIGNPLLNRLVVTVLVVLN